MKFIVGVPDFGAEVRSEGDYGGPAVDQRLTQKQRDYFAASTKVVWDVDTIAETIAVYLATDPENPTVYRRGDIAEAEPAVPEWRISVEEVFAGS